MLIFLEEGLISDGWVLIIKGSLVVGSIIHGCHGLRCEVTHRSLAPLQLPDLIVATGISSTHFLVRVG